VKTERWLNLNINRRVIERGRELARA